MQDKRRYRRFSVSLMEINGKMSLADTVEIINISFGGVAFRADRRLNIGKEYSLTLQEKEKSIVVKGIVVRSELSGNEERAGGGNVLIYTAGMMFKDGQADKISDFLSSIAQNVKEQEPVIVERRTNVRFHITAPEEKILCFPAQFKVKEISLSGMSIQVEQPLEKGTVVPMELSLSTDNVVNFAGRVASCRMMEDTELYEIGVEFGDLTDRDRTLLKTFMDVLIMMQVKAPGE